MTGSSGDNSEVFRRLNELEKEQARHTQWIEGMEKVSESLLEQVKSANDKLDAIHKDLYMRAGSDQTRRRIIAFLVSVAGLVATIAAVFVMV